MRTSIYKSAILDLFARNHLLSIADVHQALVDADYSTVYRNVEQLAADGVIKRVVLDKERVVYEKVDVQHKHDHFMCTGCGVIDAIRTCLHEESSLGKRVVSDTLVRGLCETCNSK